MQITLRKKLFGMVGFLVIALVFVGVLAYSTEKRLVNGFEALAEGPGHQEEAAMGALMQLGNAVHAFKNYLLRKDEKYADKFQTAVRKMKEELADYRKHASTDKEKGLLEEALRHIDSYVDAFGQLKRARALSDDIANIDRTIKGADRPIEKALKEMDEIAKKRYETALQEMKDKADAAVWVMILAVLLASLTGIVVSTLVLRKIMKSIDEVGRVLSGVAEGDLTHDAEVFSGDEVGRMADAVNRMAGAIRKMIWKISGVAETVVSSSEEVSATVSQITADMNRQVQQIEQSATATTEVSQTILDVANNASHASASARESVEAAQEGREVVGKTADGIYEIARRVEESSRTVEELGESSKKIGEIVNVINDIADQTNLLALNAAIEAARAGENGRGFAVVADEVRKLAERTAKATDEISEMIGRIQKDTGLSVENMRKGREMAEQGVELARQAQDALDRIVAASEQCMDKVQAIAAATEEQSAAIEEVSTNMENITEITRASKDGIDQINEATNDLARLAGELGELIGWFRISDKEKTDGKKISTGTGKAAAGTLPTGADAISGVVPGVSGNGESGLN